MAIEDVNAGNAYMMWTRKLIDAGVKIGRKM
jgi:hypothetical protein